MLKWGLGGDSKLDKKSITKWDETKKTGREENLALWKDEHYQNTWPLETDDNTPVLIIPEHCIWETGYISALFGKVNP